MADARNRRELLVLVPYCIPGLSDTYVGLFAGWIRHIFTPPNGRYELRFLMMQTSPEDLYLQAPQVLRLLPDEAFLVVFGPPSGKIGT
jgi:hypothetical protein